jgi:hypothetical protein
LSTKAKEKRPLIFFLKKRGNSESKALIIYFSRIAR